MIEKRREPRYRVCDRAFTIDLSDPQRLGEIIDISRSGMSFRCIDGQNGFRPSSELGIFSSTHSFFLKRIKFEMLGNIRLQGHPKSTIIMRRYSGRFLSLTARQQKEIDKLIDRHSQGLV